MITRPVRINVPCAYLSQLKLRCDTYKTKTSGTQNEKLFLQTPFIWSSQSTSKLCEHQAVNVVKKLDIDTVVRNKVQEDLYLTVYSNVNRKTYFLNAAADASGSQTHENKKNCTYNDVNEKITKTYIEKSTKQHATTATKHVGNDLVQNIITDSAIVTAHNLKTDSFLSKKKSALEENCCCQCSESPSTKKSNLDDKKLSDDLPTREQLNEMMTYFLAQAPLLFTQSGWSYRKCSYKVIFENEILGTETTSLNSYVFQVNFMKNLTKFVLSNPEFDILQMHRGIADGTVHVRWQVQGVPRYVKPFSMLGLLDERAFYRYLDGYSVFYINSDGLYYRHVLTKMTPLRGGNPLASKLFSNISLNRRGLGDVQKQPVFPAMQDGIK